jgi:Bacterial archaeo-eukaryotic release factor family 10
MTDLAAVLPELARLRSGSEPIVSLYLDVRWNDEQQRERVRGVVRERARSILGHYAPGAPGKPALARTLDRIQAFVEELAAQTHEVEGEGLALFACEGLGLWRPLLFARPFAEELSANGIPHLGQLARLSDEARPAIVVVPSQDGADLFEVRLGEIDAESSVRGPVARTDSEKYNAGTGQPGREFEREAKNERREESWSRKARQAAAAEVTGLFDRAAGGAHVILVGPAQTTAAFARELPDRVQAAIVARVPRSPELASSDGIRRAAICALAGEVARGARDGERDVQAVVGEALRGGIAVVGPEDVVLAANEGRVHALVVEEDFDRRGYECDNCGTLGSNVESAEICPFCAGDLRAVQNLREALVARTLAAGGRVEVVPRSSKLHSYRGVAAFLRQTAPTGLRGASPPWPTAPGANQP